jgi:hypothetical protein
MTNQQSVFRILIRMNPNSICLMGPDGSGSAFLLRIQIQLLMKLAPKAIKIHIIRVIWLIWKRFILLIEILEFKYKKAYFKSLYKYLYKYLFYFVNALIRIRI